MEPFVPIMEDIEGTVLPNIAHVRHQPNVLTPEVEEAGRRRHDRG
jgi:hypothetical protein